MQRSRLSLRDIELWVLNDEPWYRRWRKSNQPIREFIQDNRIELCTFIRDSAGTRGNPRGPKEVG